MLLCLFNPDPVERRLACVCAILCLCECICSNLSCLSTQAYSPLTFGAFRGHVTNLSYWRVVRAVCPVVLTSWFSHPLSLPAGDPSSGKIDRTRSLQDGLLEGTLYKPLFSEDQDIEGPSSPIYPLWGHRCFQRALGSKAPWNMVSLWPHVLPLRPRGFGLGARGPGQCRERHTKGAQEVDLP